MKYPKVYIIILNWNGVKDTLECLESVFKLNYSNFEVIVVDNGSTDNSVETIRKMYPQVTLIENEKNLGYAGGNNIGMRYAMEYEAEYVWLLNNDTVVESNALSKLIASADNRPEIGLISPVIYYYGEPDKIQFNGSYIDWKNKTIIYPENREPKTHEEFRIGKNVCLWGTSLLIRRSIIKKIGYLNEKYFAYWEDTEYSTRVLEAGYRNLLCLSAKIYHKTRLPTPGTVKRSEQFFYYMTRNWYFWATSYLKSIEKPSFLGKYLSNILLTVTHCYKYNAAEAANACLDGGWAAFRGIRGPWDRNIVMPGFLKKIFLLLGSWHPYFWAGLLQGNFSGIVSETLRRLKARFIGN